jgi:hypothetical protein
VVPVSADKNDQLKAEVTRMREDRKRLQEALAGEMEQTRVSLGLRGC